MKTVICIIALIYGALCVFAPVTQIKVKDRRLANIVMLGGGIMLVAASVLKWLNVSFSAVLAILGSAMICAAAISNGIKNGKVHISHHIVRIAISCVLAAGFIFFGK